MAAPDRARFQQSLTDLLQNDSLIPVAGDRHTLRRSAKEFNGIFDGQNQSIVFIGIYEFMGRNTGYPLATAFHANCGRDGKGIWH